MTAKNAVAAEVPKTFLFTFLCQWRRATAQRRLASMSAMPRTVAVLLTIASCVCAGTDSRSVIEQFKIRAAVQDITMSRQFTGSVIQTHFDSRYVITLRLQSVTPPLSGFTNGSIVSFAIHSPALLFAGETPKGKTVDFVVSRETWAGGSCFFGLAVERQDGQKGGPANQSQPAGLKTNRASSAAGPGG
jgi:hypothetical protein